MARQAFAIPIAADQVDDLRRTAADIREGALDEFGRNRADVGLTTVEIWLQETSRGFMLLVYTEGDLESAFPQIASGSGFDAWARQKLLQWAERPEDVERVYSMTPSDELIVWTVDG
jgi:hypothetical protein